MRATSAAASTSTPIASSQTEPFPATQTRLARQISGTQSSSQSLNINLRQPGASNPDKRDVSTNSQRPERGETADGSAGRVIGLVSDSNNTLRADRELQVRMLEQLERHQNIPVSIPAGSLIEKPFDLYKQALNDPKVLAWFESKGLALETLNIQEHSISATDTYNGVSNTQTFTVYDNSGWWQVSAQVLAARQVLDPANIGLPYVDEDRKLIPCDVILDFYGVVPPNSDEEASTLADRLKREGWPKITADEKVELDNECHCVKELIREAKARVQLINELGDVVKDKADKEILSLSGQFSESASDSPLAHKSLAILNHLNDFFALPEMIALCESENIDGNSLPVRVVDNKIQVFIQPSQWYDLTDLVKDQVTLTVPFKALLAMVKGTGNALYAPLKFDFQQILSFRGFSVPQTAGEVRNIIRWLQTALPQATPLGDYGAELLADPQSPVRLTAADRAKIINVAQQFSDDAGSIIDALGADLLINTSVEYRRNNADELLSKMFEKDQSDSWGHLLLQALNWYGAGGTAYPEHYQKLLLAAIKLEVDPDAPGKPGTIAGYDIYQPKNLGRDLTVVRAEIEQHLIDHKGVSAQAAPLVAHLFLADVAPEFLAQDLREGIQVGTATWMTLSLGVAIAEVLDPGCSRVMTTEQLMALALLEPTTPEQQLLFRSLAVDISIKWAVMNGVIQRRADSSYTSDGYKTATSKFATQRKDLVQALEGFKRELVTRKELAAIELRKVFPSDLGKPMEDITIGPLQYEHFDKEISGDEKSIVEAYMDGDLSSVSLQMSNVGMENSAFNRCLIELPDLNDVLTTSVDSFFKARKDGLITSTKFLISTLPLEDRQSLELGEVRAFTLREETGKLQEDETPPIQAAFRGRQGTLLRCEYQDGEEKKVSYFEVFPGRMLIIKRPDLPDELPLDGKMETEQAKISKGPAVSVKVQRGTELPFDFAAYAKGSEPVAGAKSEKLIIEELGGRLPAKPVNVDDSTSVPNSYFSKRTSDIVDKIINDNLLQGERDFLFEKAKGTTTEEENRAYQEKVNNFLLQLIPFVGCTEDLRSGDRIRFINGAFGCFTDLVSSLNTVAGGVGKLSTVLKSVAPIRTTFFVALQLGVDLINPAGGTIDVVRGFVRTVGGIAKLFKSGTFALTKAGIARLQTCTDRLRGYFGGFASGAAAPAQPSRVNTFVHRVTGTVDGSDMMAIRENGKWYALDKKGNPIGRALDNFIALTA